MRCDLMAEIFISCVVLGDWGGDGDAEVFVGDCRGEIRVFLHGVGE